jgi:hypothetical protein
MPLRDSGYGKNPRRAHPVDQRSESQVIAKVPEQRVLWQEDHLARVFGARLLQESEGTFAVVETGVNPRELVR